ncbi:MAG: orotate phosphoribosyltransferase, partial [Cyanobacteriota bacterium]|nr:orotate phosphoribosyltransferase [Cyanobacteriota bacterium]
AARVVQHHPGEQDPLYLRIVRESQLWATPEQLLLEVGTSDPEILAKVRQEVPERFLILRSLWGEEDRLEALLQAGLSQAADGLLLPLPQNLLVEDRMEEGAARLKRRINDLRAQRLDERRPGDTAICSLWLPEPAATGAGVDRLSPKDPPVERDPMADLILDLFDIGCLLFGEYVQASGAVFNYYIDLRQIISDPNLFHRVLHAYAGRLRELAFDRIAGIPYGSLPTATGLSLQLHKPLIYPRKEVKAHGARRLIEGDFEEGDTVVVVDDILITGGSVLEGIAKLESSGLVVQDVVVFIDHGGDHDRHATERLAAAGYRCHAVLDIGRITEVLHRAGRLSDTQAATLLPGITLA